MKDLKGKTIRGGLARMFAQAANFLLRLVTLMILARLLEPNDFGLVGMVTAFTGVLSLFRDFGLSAASIQRDQITQEQVSTLFWINILVGFALALIAVAMSPVLAVLYHEPKLVAINAALALGFVFNSVGIQHGAMLQREMRFTAVAIINTTSLLVSGAVAIVTARLGFRYWALVLMAVTFPLAMSISSWVASGWSPGRPHRRAGIRSMIRFGGTLTANSLVVYVANNLDKVLLGKYWGVNALGIYGRAYQLVSIPIDNLNSSAGEVAFSALSRIQSDASRLRNYFLKGYALILAITIPITIACALFANDIITILLGPKWHAAIPIFRLLAPTILGFAIVNPFGWFLYSRGMAGRALKMALVIAPIMIIGYIVGLKKGPEGVALAYSVVMVLWIIPAICWAIHGTTLSLREVIATVARPLGAGVASGLLAFAAAFACAHVSSLVRLVVEMFVLLSSYGFLLLFVSGDRALYMDVLRGVRGTPVAEEKSLVAT
jgi:PST family polysaccharide transporter